MAIKVKRIAVSLVTAVITSLFTLYAPTALSAETPTPPALEGIVIPHPAPQWDIEQWINADPGNVDTNHNKVVVIDFFQMWCPGCNTFTGPLMQQWQDRFSDEIASGDLVLVKIHTVFEGHSYQTTHKLKTYLKDKNITMPVGVDRHSANDYLPETKKQYKTRGTPEIVMIDRMGMIRFQQFGWFDPAAAETYLESLLGGEPSPKRLKPVEVCLASELCG